MTYFPKWPSWRIVTSYLAVVLLAATVAGCGGSKSKDDQTSAATGVDGVNLKAEADPESGTLIFPADRLLVNSVEQGVLFSATNLALADCAGKKGVELQASLPKDDIALEVNNYFGVWVKKYAEQFGFVHPQSEADMVANQITRGGQPVVAANDAVEELPGKSFADLSPADKQVVTDCRSDTSVKQFDLAKLTPKGPWSTRLGDADSAFGTRGDVKAVIAEYDACLVSSGLAPDADTALSVSGASYTEITEDQIKLALQVVDCKTKVRAVPRLADIMATLQAPILKKYSRELVAQREHLDAALAVADKLIASHRS